MSNPLLTDAFKRAVLACLEAFDPFRRYREFHEYRVITGIGATGFALQPVDSDTMPTILAADLYPGAPSALTYTLGAKVLVGFINANPARPFIAFDGAVVRHGDSLGGVTPGAYVVVKVPPP